MQVINQGSVARLCPRSARRPQALPRGSAPRLPFAALLEHGLLLPGQELFFNQQRAKAATVLADGSLRTADGAKGSIHKIGALIGGLPACNGWEHWYLRDEQGAMMVIDALREKIRSAKSASLLT